MFQTILIGDHIFFLILQNDFLVLDRGFEPQSGQTEDYKIGMCCFSAKHEALLKRMGKDLFIRNQDNVSEMGDMSIRGLLFQ